MYQQWHSPTSSADRRQASVIKRSDPDRGWERIGRYHNTLTDTPTQGWYDTLTDTHTQGWYDTLTDTPTQGWYDTLTDKPTQGWYDHKRLQARAMPGLAWLAEIIINI